MIGDARRLIKESLSVCLSVRCSTFHKLSTEKKCVINVLHQWQGIEKIYIPTLYVSLKEKSLMNIIGDHKHLRKNRERQCLSLLRDGAEKWGGSLFKPR